MKFVLAYVAVVYHAFLRMTEDDDSGEMDRKPSKHMMGMQFNLMCGKCY